MISDGQLMPEPDTAVSVVNANGHQRSNRSWTIGRLFRDFEHRTESKLTDGSLGATVLAKNTCSEKNAKPKSQLPVAVSSPRKREALRVTVFNVDVSKVPGHPTWDFVYYLGVLVILTQIGIAIIPWGLYGNYLPFIVTFGGNALSLLSGMLPQWMEEKFANYKTEGWTVSITRGNGSRHVMLILGKGHVRNFGLDLEIMAAQSRQGGNKLLTRFGSILLAALWTVLLITVTGTKQEPWCLSSFFAIKECASN